MKFQFELTEREFAAVMQVANKSMETEVRAEQTRMADRAVDRLIGFADRTVSKAFNGWDLSEEMPGLSSIADYSERNASALSSTFAKILPLFAQMMSGEFGNENEEAASTTGDTPADSTGDTPAASEANEYAE